MSRLHTRPPNTASHQKQKSCEGRYFEKDEKIPTDLTEIGDKVDTNDSDASLVHLVLLEPVLGPTVRIIWAGDEVSSAPASAVVVVYLTPSVKEATQEAVEENNVQLTVEAVHGCPPVDITPTQPVDLL